MQPNLAGWDKKYAEKGLVVIDVDNGERDTLPVLKEHVKEAGIGFPVLFDEKAKNASAYGVKGFPAAFLVDASGKVVWEGFPVPEVEEVEKLMEKVLADVKLPVKAPAKDSKDKETKSASGLRYIDLKPGTGDSPKKGDTVQVHYTGWLEDGKKFDSSVDRGEPFAFQIGMGQVIPGWDEGVGSMKVGGKRKLIIPASLGYGDQGAGDGLIPPGATLIFEVELLGIQR